MMKKILFSLMLLLGATAAWAGTDDGSDGLNLPVNAEGYIEVRTADELVAAIRADNSAKIRLEADSIDIGGIGKICETFKGAIVGGHEIIIPETGERRIAPRMLYSSHEGADSYLFEKVEGAFFEYVAFMNFRVQDEDNDNLGVVARTAESTTFRNVSTVNVSVFCNHDNAGTIVGYAQDCIFEVVRVIASNATTDGIGAGGIVGSSSSCQFTSCATNQHTYVFSDGRQGPFFQTNAACAGGISGYSSGDHFFDCVNFGWVGGDEDQVGGIVGTSIGSQFNLCTNAGVVLQASEENFKKAMEGSLKETIDYSSWMYQVTSFWVALGEALFAVEGVGIGSTLMILSGDLHGFIGGVMFWVAAVGVVTLVVTNMIMSAHDELGGIVGHAEGGSFEQCANEGLYNAVDEECGGIVGKGSSLIINNCYSVRKPGGIPHIQDVKKLETNAAIIGSADGCLITNNYAICKYRAIGKAENMNPASGNNYYVSDSEIAEVSAYEMHATTEQMQSGQLAYWLNNLHRNTELPMGPWRQNLTGDNIDSSPKFDPTHAPVTVADITTITHITDAAGLESFAQRVHSEDQFACAVLDNDITLSGSWTPIGNSTNRFRGIFDGQGHTISGLMVEMASDEQGAGLFGTVHNNAIIRNVIVDSSCSFTNTKDGGAAGIVGLLNTGWNWSEVLIENCASYASVNANKHAGGILGRVITTDKDGGLGVNVYVNNCYSMGTITATNGYSGLLCGYTKDHGHISNCWSAGSLKSSSSVTPYDAAHNEFFCGYEAKLDIKNCYAIGAESNVQDLGMQATQNGVSRLSSEALNSGSLTYHLNGDQNDATKSLSWQQNLGTDTYPVFGSKGVFHTREINKEIGTVCLPFTLKSDDAISYYAFTGASTDGSNATSLNFDYVETVAPGQPVLFRVASTGDINFSDPVGDSWSNAPIIPDNADWTLHGTFTERNYTLETSTSSKTIYYVSDGAIKNAKQVTIKPYRAFFSGPNIDDLKNSPSGARVSIVIDGLEEETSALELIADDLVSGQGTKVYTLYGTEAGEDYHGIVIRGCKKMLR